MTAHRSSGLAEMETSVDGRRVLFRPIRPEDKQRIREGFERLSPQSRYRRFFRHIERLTDKDLRYLTEVDFVDHVVWIALLADEPDQPGIGAARWIRVAHEPDVAEGAVTVVDDWQGRGIGKTLLYLLATSARARGIRAFRAWVMGENRPILGLLEDVGVRYGRWESGVVQVDVPLPDDPEYLQGSAAPLVLKEVASGRLAGQERARGRGTSLREGDAVYGERLQARQVTVKFCHAGVVVVAVGVGPRFLHRRSADRNPWPRCYSPSSRTRIPVRYDSHAPSLSPRAMRRSPRAL